MTKDTAERGLDVKLFGALFLLVGLLDVLIIELFPAYALKLFGITIAGPLAYAVKLHSPAIHFFIGYGFVFASLGLGPGDGLWRFRRHERIDESG